MFDHAYTQVVKPHKKKKLRAFDALDSDHREPQYEYDMSVRTSSAVHISNLPVATQVPYQLNLLL